MFRRLLATMSPFSYFVLHCGSQYVSGLEWYLLKAVLILIFWSLRFIEIYFKRYVIND